MARLIIIHLAIGIPLIALGGFFTTRPPNNHFEVRVDHRAPQSRKYQLRLGEAHLRHEVTGKAIAFSTDGKVVHTGGTDGVLSAWDVATGRRVATSRTEPADAITAIVHQGSNLAVGHRSGTVSLWDVQRNKLLWKSTRGKASIKSLAFAPNGRRLLVGDSVGLARLWDVTDGKEVDPPPPLGHGPLILAWSPKGDVVAAATSGDRVIRLWDSKKWTEIRALELDLGGVADFCFDPIGKHLLACGSKGSIALWEVATAKRVANLKADDQLFEAIAFSPDGRGFMSGSQTGAIIWDAITWKRVATLEESFDRVPAIAYASDGLRVATGGSDGVIRVWDARTGKQVQAPSGHQSRVAALTITPDGKTLVSGGWDRTIRLWSVPSGKPLRTLTWAPTTRSSHTAATVSSLSLADNGRLLAGATYAGPVIIWNLDTGDQFATVKRSPPGAGSVAFTKNGDSLLLGGMDGSLGLWDIKANKFHREFKRDGGVRQLAISPSGDSFACAGQAVDLDIELRSLKVGEVLQRFPLPYDTPRAIETAGVAHFAYTLDGKLLVAAREDRQGGTRRPIRVFEVAMGKERLSFGEGGCVTSLAVAPDSKVVATGQDDGTISLWDIATGRRKEWFTTDLWAIHSLTFSPSGEWLFAGGQNGTICGWSIQP